MTTTPKRPIVRYHGGKWKLAPWIIEHFPKHKVYVEPYGGGGSVLLRKPRSYAEIYNDLDGEIVNLFRVARDHGAELVRQLELTSFSRSEFLESYIPSGDSVAQARKTVTRAFQGFGSNAHNKATGFRSNSNRSGTTPARDWLNLPKSLKVIVSRLQGVVIENREAEDVLKAHDGAETLHYVDPPYVSTTRDKGGDYRHEMTDSDHREMAEVLNSLQGMIVLSGYRCELYDELFSNWTRVERKAFADGAKERTECLWLRNIELPQELF